MRSHSKLSKEGTTVKIFRYSKANGSINIGTRSTKLTIFFRQKCICFTFNGRRIAHWGRSFVN